MPGTFTCQKCDNTYPRNPRIKNQKYCSSPDCQQARKNAWGKKAYNTSKSHRDKRLQSQKRCYKNRPGHVYQDNYRKSHPEYVVRNRERQQERNKKRQNDQASMIVNTDALSLQPNIDGAYALIKVTKEGKIVNTDALMVQLRVMRGIQAF
jgi:hypothetical protein